MGYTHYWYQKRPLSSQEWAAITKEAKRIVAAASKSIKLCGPNGTGKPEFDKVIALNGTERNDEGHESFVLEQVPTGRAYETGVFNFCKTAEKPYDPVVVSILFAARKIAPDAIKVSSDGGDEAIKLLF